MLILRLGNHSYPYVSAAIARSLGRRGIEVFQAHCGPARADRHSRWLMKDFRLPDNPPIERIEEIGERLGHRGRAIILPVDDPSAMLVDIEGERLARLFNFQRQPPGLAVELGDKARLAALCHRLDLPTPSGIELATEESLRTIAPSLDYPTVLKVADGRRRRAESVHIAASPIDLIDAGLKMGASPDDLNLIAQEYIPGGADSVWMFNGCFDERSHLLFGYTGRKLRQYPPHSGVTSLGVIEMNQHVFDLVQRLASATGYRGVIDVGVRHDARDDRYLLLDVNPRIGATFRLFADRAGNDVVTVAYEDMIGAPISTGPPADGRRWMVENYDLRSSAAYWRQGMLTPLVWIRSLRGVQEGAWFARDDLRPFGNMVLQSAGDLGRAGLGVWRRRRAPN